MVGCSWEHLHNESTNIADGRYALLHEQCELRSLVGETSYAAGTCRIQERFFVALHV